LEGRVNDIVLDAQILEKKLHRIIIVRLYPADLRCRENHDVGRCFRKEVGNRRFVTEIELRSIARDEVNETFRFESPNERAPHHSPMTGH
jgi:hypothetical protein